MLRNILSYILGSLIFFVAGPYLIVYLSEFSDMDFMPTGLPAMIFGSICSATGLYFVISANYELLTKGHGGAVVVGSVKLSRETDTLVVTGPYSLCRNPMHMGLMLFYFGLCCAINSFITLIIPVLMWMFSFLFAVLIDEPRLKRDFPLEYEKWVKDVPQRFWPKPKKAS